MRFTTLLREAACGAISLSLVCVLVITGALLVFMEWALKRSSACIAYLGKLSTACSSGKTKT